MARLKPLRKLPVEDAVTRLRNNARGLLFPCSHFANVAGLTPNRVADKPRLGTLGSAGSDLG